MKLRNKKCCLTYVCSNDSCKGVRPYTCVNGTPRHTRALFPARAVDSSHTTTINDAMRKALRSSIIFVNLTRTYMVKCQTRGCESNGVVQENIEPFDCKSCGNTYCSATCEKHTCSTYHVPDALRALRDSRTASVVDTTRAANQRVQADKPVTAIDLTANSQNTHTDSQTSDTVSNDQDSGQDSQPNIYCCSDDDGKDDYDDMQITPDVKEHEHRGSDAQNVSKATNFVDIIIERAKHKRVVTVNGRQILFVTEGQSDISDSRLCADLKDLEVMLSCC